MMRNIRKPENVTEAQAALVAVVWFGSLAALAALAGPLSAMVALGLQEIPELKPSRHSWLRRKYLGWRWRRVRTIKQIVKVPVEVEKFVEKRIEVPVEIEKVIKEFVYVPVPMNAADVTTVYGLLKQRLGEDAADQVIRSALGGQSAGKA